MKDNVQKMAEEIYDIEHAPFSVRKEWILEHKECWELSGNIYMTKSENCMVWNLWKYYDDQPEAFWKCVPISGTNSKKDIENIIKAQVWLCI